VHSQLTHAREWKRLFDGVNETATQLYLIIDERMRERGIYEVLGDEWMSLDELRERLGIDAPVMHRFRLAMEALRNLGLLELDGDRARVRSSERPNVDLDTELIAWTFGPLLDAYLAMYRSDVVFDPNFALQFDEGMDDIWDGLLNANINLLPRDLAVEWVSTRGGRVLDLGFGTPYTLRQLAEAVGDDGRVCGLDISDHFVRRAQNELADVGQMDEVVCADINDGLGMFEDDSFDGVMFTGALHFVTDLDAHFAEVRRVLKPRMRVNMGMFFIDKPCYSGPGLQLHRSFFNPPGILRSEHEVVDALWRHGFELTTAIHVGCYCSLFLEQRSLVQGV
jgi:SAM-dependent methyltransferase